MNRLLILISCLLISCCLFASEPACTTDTGQTELKGLLNISTDVPEFLKGAVIVVRLKDGTETTVPAEKFKVVPRKQQFIITKTEVKTITKCNIGSAVKNRVSAAGGAGLNGSVKTETEGSTVKVTPGIGFVGGLQYQRKVYNNFSLGLQGLSNGTGLLMIGLDF